MTATDRVRRVAAFLLAGLALGGATAGCGKKEGVSPRSLVELRPVLDTGAPPCKGKAPKGGRVLSRTQDGKVECLTLGPPIADAGDVRSATVAETPSGEPALSLVLGQVGAANLDGFAKTHDGKRLGLVADGALVSAPVIHAVPFAGRIQVTGLSKEKTDDLFRRLNKLMKLGN